MRWIQCSGLSVLRSSNFQLMSFGESPYYGHESAGTEDARPYDHGDASHGRYEKSQRKADLAETLHFRRSGL